MYGRKPLSFCFITKPEVGTTACYNGNISEWEWQQGTNVEQLYGFTYDPVSRLKETNQYRHAGTTWSVSPNDYVEKGITYDRNGNILTLQRTGNGTLLTNLTLSYRGNQQSGQSYDANGNKISGRGMHYTYNVLGLQDKVFQDNTNALKAQYDYMANGIKLRLRDGSGSNGYDYDGKFIYSLKNGTLSLDLVTFAEGQFTVNGVRYALRDHLRNVRALVNANGTIVEQNDYYPYGGVHSKPDYLNAGNRYLLSGKEEQLLTDAGTYDFGFRMYDSNTGSWNAMDKLCEKHYEHTPYMYAFDNPLRYIDLWGLDFMESIGEEFDGGTLQEIVVTGKKKSANYIFLWYLQNKEDKDYVSERYEKKYSIHFDWNKHKQDVSELNELQQILSYGNVVFSILAEKRYSEYFGTWTGKNGKLYDMSFNGSGSTGGKYKYARNSARKLEKIGRGFGYLDIVINILDVSEGQTPLTSFTVETMVDFFSMYGGIHGLAFGIGWDLGAEYGPIQYYMEHKY